MGCCSEATSYMLLREMASCTRVWQRSLAPMPACPSMLIRVLLQICSDIPDKLTLALAVCQLVSVVRTALELGISAIAA
jgi:hypothetical protein